MKSNHWKLLATLVCVVAMGSWAAVNSTQPTGPTVGDYLRNAGYPVPTDSTQVYTGPLFWTDGIRIIPTTAEALRRFPECGGVIMGGIPCTCGRGCPEPCTSAACDCKACTGLYGDR